MGEHSHHFKKTIAFSGVAEGLLNDCVDDPGGAQHRGQSCSGVRPRPDQVEVVDVFVETNEPGTPAWSEDVQRRLGCLFHLDSGGLMLPRVLR